MGQQAPWIEIARHICDSEALLHMCVCHELQIGQLDLFRWEKG